MRSTKLLLCIGMLSSFVSMAQDELSKNTYYPFQKGNWNFPLQKDLDIFHRTDWDDNDNKTGRRNEINLNLDKTYFVARNFGIDFDYCLDWWCEEDDYSDREWTGRLGLVYGTKLSDNFYLYGELGGIYGRDRYDQSNTIDKSHESGYFLEAGLPINIGNHTYLTPRIGWTHLTTDFGASKDVEKSFGFNIGLESYLGCNEMICDHKQGFSLSKGKYEQGNSFLSFESMGNFRFGSTETTFTVPSPSSSEYDFTGAHLSANYRYNFIDNLAIGAKLNLGTKTQEGQNSTYKNSNTNWSVSPRITYNFPLENGWNNLFVEGGGGFGTQKTKTTIGNSISETKFNKFNYGAWAGRNFWFTNSLSAVAQLGYLTTLSKNADTDIKTKTHSLSIEIGTQFHFK